jgi:NADH:ubiquinone oxidoreductase subunit K
MKNYFHKFVFSTVFLLVLTCFTVNAQFESKIGIARQLLTPLSTEGILVNKNLNEMQVSSETFSKASALNHIYFQQYIEGIPYQSRQYFIYI